MQTVNLVVLVAFVTFASGLGFTTARFNTRGVQKFTKISAESAPKADDPEIKSGGDWAEVTEKSGVPLKEAPYGKRQFFAADVGAVSGTEDFGGGDVGGNEYTDALFHAGPRGKNKPLIGDKAIVKLPSMSKVERGYSEAKAKKVFEAKKQVWKDPMVIPWTKEEDETMLRLIAEEQSGARGRWVRISKVINRSVTACSLRWTQHLREQPVPGQYKDILRDADRDLIVQKEGGHRWSDESSWSTDKK